LFSLETILLQIGLASELDHGRRSTHQRYSALFGSTRKVILDHFLTDETRRILPLTSFLRRAVECVPKVEAFVLGTFFELFAEEDISFSLVGKD